MENLPVHMRISTLTPSNEDVDARRATIGELSAAWIKVTDVDPILAKAGMVADALGGDGRPHGDLGTEVQGALQNHASAYLYKEKPLGVGICAGMAVMSLLPAPRAITAGPSRTSTQTPFGPLSLSSLLWRKRSARSCVGKS